MGEKTKGYAVEVNEGIVFAASGGGDWWLSYRRCQPPARLTMVKEGWPGILVRVACDGKEDTRMLADLMVTNGGLPRAR